MAIAKAEQGRRAIILDAQRQGWQVFRNAQPLATSLVLFLPADPPILLHVDVIPDRMNGTLDGERTKLTEGGINSRVVHSPSEVGQFCRDLADIATTRRAP